MRHPQVCRKVQLGHRVQCMRQGIAEPAFIENHLNVAPLTARDAYWQDPSRNMSEFFDFSTPAMPNAPNGQPGRRS